MMFHLLCIVGVYNVPIHMRIKPELCSIYYVLLVCIVCQYICALNRNDVPLIMYCWCV